MIFQNWSFSFEVLSCGEPPSVANSVRDFTSLVFESEATYTCLFGYKIAGQIDVSLTIKCDVSPENDRAVQWSILTITCESI